MTDWTSGYVADIGYTYGYYNELLPQRMRMAFLDRGLAVPTLANACELGFGQGVSANIHAAASGTQWWGTDFNPSQAQFAQELAAASGAGARLFDQSFEEFCGRDDLPDFDFIGMHGLWTWVSDDNRRCIVDFIRRKLRPGGVVYVSYNTFPGWAQMAPVRHLLARHSEMTGRDSDTRVQRVGAALDFAEALLALKPGFARVNTQVADRFARLRKMDRSYLAHEYFNRDWAPMHFLEMADWLRGAKLDFACSAHYFDLVEPVNFTPEQQEFLRGVPDRMLREAVRDFLVNQQFRRDYWVKGGRTLPNPDKLAQTQAARLLLVTRRDAVGLKVQTPLGEAALNEDVYVPVLEAMAAQQPMTVAQVERAVARRKVNRSQLMQALIILMGKGDVQLVQGDEETARAKPHCEKLNRHLVGLARFSGDVTHLASPVTGGGFPVQRFHQLFLAARAGGAEGAEALADGAWEALKSVQQLIVHDGRTLEGEEESRAHLKEQAARFLADTLPTLQALQVA